MRYELCEIGVITIMLEITRVLAIPSIHAVEFR